MYMHILNAYQMYWLVKVGSNLMVFHPFKSSEMTVIRNRCVANVYWILYYVAVNMRYR